MKHKAAGLLGLFCLVTAGVSAQPADPFGRLPRLTTVTGSKIAEPWMNFGPGKTYQNNWWYDTFRTHLNVDLQWTLTGGFGTYDTVFQPALATGQLPDMIFTLQANEAEQLIRRADRLVQPWDEALEKWASPRLKELMAFNNREILKPWRANGKTYGLASSIPEPSMSFIWLRADWLRTANLKAPTTLAELERVMDTLVRLNPGKAATPYGITWTNPATLGSIEPAFRTSVSWHNAIERDGVLVSPAIQPETRTFWSRLATWYQKGYLAKDFFTKTEDDATADFQTGKVGIVLSGTNLPDSGFGQNFVRVNKGVELSFVPLPGETAQGPLHIRNAAYTNNLWLSRNASPAVIEAIVKMLNVKLAVNSLDHKPAYAGSDADYDNGPDGQPFWSVFLIGPDDTRRGEQGMRAHTDYFSRKVSVDQIPPSSRNIVKSMYDWVEKGTSAPDYVDNWKWFTMANPQGTWAFERDYRARNPGQFYTAPYWGTSTETITRQSGNLTTKYQELSTKAVVEGKVDQYFAEWVKFFDEQGGKKAFEEINAAWAAQMRL